MSDEIKQGDIVRVRDPKQYTAAFAKKVADRDAVVEWVGPDRHGQYIGRAKVRFLKRNGRGAEFSEIMQTKFLLKTAQTSVEGSAFDAPLIAR